jgi:hypothetical protein
MANRTTPPMTPIIITRFGSTDEKIEVDDDLFFSMMISVKVGSWSFL